MLIHEQVNSRQIHHWATGSQLPSDVEQDHDWQLDVEADEAKGLEYRNEGRPSLYCMNDDQTRQPGAFGRRTYDERRDCEHHEGWSPAPCPPGALELELVKRTTLQYPCPSESPAREPDA